MEDLVFEVDDRTDPIDIWEWYEDFKYIDHKVNLYYSEPVRLYAKRGKGKTSKEHTVKKLFLHGGSLAYIPMGMKRSGNYLTMEVLDAIEIVPKGYKDYRKEWERIADSMYKYGINEDIADDIYAHLAGEEDHIRGFQNYWTLMDKPKTKSFKSVLGGLSLQDMIDRMEPSSYTEGRLVYSKRKYGSKRDMTVEIYTTEDDGLRYMAASEFAGTGNGDYYVMYSPTMAFFAESD